jgi:NAD(P)-dependent dehydrogenase (short-subunit alcohol dehydrogenase family)
VGKLDGKRALVTGGASGIGYAIAQLFLENGASLVIADVDGSKLAAAEGELAAYGTVRAVEGDVRSMVDAGRMVKAVVDDFGGLDIVVCNAGITSVRSIEYLDEEEWDAVLATNVKGMFTVIKHAIPHLRDAGGGTIVTLGSEMAIVAVPESPAYNASKGAVVMFTKSLALDLVRYGIRVNALCPGITRTPLLQSEVDDSADPAKTAAEQASWAPMLRVADPREIAKGALFLASDDSSFATGSCLLLDGGFTAR